MRIEITLRPEEVKEMLAESVLKKYPELAKAGEIEVDLYCYSNTLIHVTPPEDEPEE